MARAYLPALRFGAQCASRRPQRERERERASERPSKRGGTRTGGEAGGRAVGRPRGDRRRGEAGGPGRPPRALPRQPSPAAQTCLLRRAARTVRHKAGTLSRQAQGTASLPATLLRHAPASYAPDPACSREGGPRCLVFFARTDVEAWVRPLHQRVEHLRACAHARDAEDRGRPPLPPPTHTHKAAGRADDRGGASCARPPHPPPQPWPWRYAVQRTSARAVVVEAGVPR